MTAARNIDWNAEDELQDGEELLWQGRPGTEYRLFGRDALTMIVIAAASTFAGVYGIQVSMEPGEPWWALPFFWFLTLLGIAVVPGSALSKQYRRRATRYALTNRRAVIRRWGRVWSYPIREWKTPRVVSDGKGISSVMFYESRSGRTYSDEGFDALDNAEAIAELMKDVVRAAISSKQR